MIGFLPPPIGDYKTGINPQFQGNLLLKYSTLKTEAACSFTTLVNLYKVTWHHGGTAVAQLVEALRYKSEGHGLDSRWCHWNFSLT